eukprot:XP_016662322.1 PREDICTED: uncharacterized protein LOC107884528 [Acyrthosiphon pisum]
MICNIISNDMLAGIAMSLFSELPSAVAVQKFLLLLLSSPCPARTTRTSICSRKLFCPNRPVDPVSVQNEHTCRFHRPGQHFRGCDCGSPAKVDFQTISLLAAS